MKLESFILACGGEVAISTFINAFVKPYRIHADDMTDIVKKIIDLQDHFTHACRYSVSIWDTAWPHRVWMFNHEYSAFNRADDDPGRGHYLKPMLQISAQKSNGEPQPLVIHHVLKNRISR